MSESPRPVLDAEVIENLKLLGGDDDPALFRDLVEIFLKETPALIAKLEDALGRGDAHALERAAHSLKSSCANLGALTLSAQFKEMELAGRAKDVELARPVLVASRSEFVAVQDALKSLL
jgi:HPt (histidine-containing phosphotransfer) domain-containing protein